MKKETALGVGLAVAVLLFLFKNKLMTYYDVLSSFIPKVEGFRAFPYLDYKQYSWGYGTRVPDKYMKDGKPIAGVHISRAQAFIDMMNHVQNDARYLSKLIKTELNPRQWAALLSFSYNLGAGNADNLVPNINARNWSALEEQWKLYNKAGGKVNADLVARRAKEWALFVS